MKIVRELSEAEQRTLLDAFPLRTVAAIPAAVACGFLEW